MQKSYNGRPIHEITTSAVGNSLLILSGAKKTFIGAADGIEKGDLIYISNEKGQTIPVIADSIEKRPLASLTTAEWNSAGHVSAQSYAKRLASVDGARPSHAESQLTLGAAEHHVANASANILTFHVPTFQELLPHCTDIITLVKNARTVVDEVEPHGATQAAFEFAEETLGIPSRQLVRNARKAVSEMGRTIGTDNGRDSVNAR